MPQLIYKPRSPQASLTLRYATPIGVIELSENPVELTTEQIEWLKINYPELKLSFESFELLVIDTEPQSVEAGLEPRRPRSKAALPTDTPLQE